MLNINIKRVEKFIIIYLVSFLHKLINLFLTEDCPEDVCHLFELIQCNRPIVVAVKYLECLPENINPKYFYTILSLSACVMLKALNAHKTDCLCHCGISKSSSRRAAAFGEISVLMGQC